MEHFVLRCLALAPGAHRPALPELRASMQANALGRALLEYMAHVIDGRSLDAVRQWEATYGPLAEAVVGSFACAGQSIVIALLVV